VSILAWIILGALCGVIAEHLTGRRTGLILATVVGIVGALLGGFLAKALFGVNGLNGFFNISTWITAIIGSIILFGILWLVSGRGRART